jgi:hypothetical protein
MTAERWNRRTGLLTGRADDEWSEEREIAAMFANLGDSDNVPEKEASGTSQLKMSF